MAKLKKIIVNPAGIIANFGHIMAKGEKRFSPMIQ